MTKLLYFALSLIGGGIVVSFVFSVVIAVLSKRADSCAASNAAPPPVTVSIPYSPDPVISRILANPYVLLDERIRQLHEVQNLLQYPEIQQVFFEPPKLYSLFSQKRVETLLNIVRVWITQNNAEEIFSAAEQRRPSNSPAAAVQTGKPAVKSVAVVFIVLFASIFIFIITVTLFGSIFGSHGS